MKEREKARIAEMRIEAEREWPRRWDTLMMSDEPWPNTADQLRHNLGTAIVSLEGGRPIMIVVGEIGFSKENAIVTTYQTFTDIYQGIPEGEFDWSDWFEKTNSVFEQRGYHITCRMQSEALSELKVGQRVVIDAHIADLQGEHLALTCTNPRPQSDAPQVDGD